MSGGLGLFPVLLYSSKDSKDSISTLSALPFLGNSFCLVLNVEDEMLRVS